MISEELTNLRFALLGVGLGHLWLSSAALTSRPRIQVTVTILLQQDGNIKLMNCHPGDISLP